MKQGSQAGELILEAGTRARKLVALREVWGFRGTVLAFAERDIRVKYKQAVFGIIWSILQPLMFMAVFTITLGHLAKVPGGGVSYAAFSLSVLVPWTYLSGSVTVGANDLVGEAPMLRRVYFPREVPVISTIVGSSLDFAIGLTLFFIVGPIVGAHVTWMWLFAPILFAMLALLAASVALPFAALNVYYRDFRFALPFGVQLWLFACPVAYPLSVVPDRWKGLYVAINPAAGILDGFSNALARGVAPDMGRLGISLAGTSVIGSLGYLLFKRLEPNFADVI